MIQVENNPKELSQMADFVLEINAMTTTEFCKKYKIDLPYFTGEVESSAEQFIRLDGIKYRMLVNHAKKWKEKESDTWLLNKQLTQYINLPWYKRITSFRKWLGLKKNTDKK